MLRFYFPDQQSLPRTQKNGLKMEESENYNVVWVHVNKFMLRKQHTETLDPVFTWIVTLNPIVRCPIPKTWNLNGSKKY